MKGKNAVVFLVVLFLATILASPPTFAQLPDYSPQGLKAATFEQVLALPDEQIDLATAILILCQEWDSRLEMEEFRKEIDKMAAELTTRISPQTEPQRIVTLFNEYLFEEKGYSSAASFDPEYCFLPSVIENRQGNCLGLSLLYLVVAERIGIPLYGVLAPDHTFVRYDDGKRRINIETTKSGQGYEDSYYEEWGMLPSFYRGYNFYLRNLSQREMIGIFLNNRGRAYYGKGKLDQAISDFKQALAINPNYAEAYNNRGVAHFHKGELDRAIKDYCQALRINPNYAKAYNNRGVVYCRKGIPGPAIRDYNRALKLNPNWAEAYYNRGLAYYDKGEFDKAIRDYDKTLVFNPHEAKVYCRRGLAYYGQGELDQAIRDYDQALKLNPNWAEAYYNRGLAYYDKGEFDKAIRDYDKTLVFNPHEAKVYCRRGLAYYGQGELDQAIEDYSQAVRFNPHDSQAYYYRGVAHHARGELDRAIGDYSQALALNHNFALAYNYRGVAYAMLGEYREHLKIFTVPRAFSPTRGIRSR